VSFFTVDPAFQTASKHLESYVGEEIFIGKELKAKVEGMGDFNNRIDWLSSNTKVARVKDQQIKMLTAGNVKLTAISQGDKTRSDSSSLTVLPPVVSGVKLNVKNFELDVNETKQLTVTVETKGKINPAVIWFSSDSAVATTDATGLVTAKAKGTAEIQAISIADSSQKGLATVTIPTKSVDIPSIAVGAVLTVGAIAVGVTAAPAVAIGVAAAFVFHWLGTSI
jgi:uncharacterized protein YjdB